MKELQIPELATLSDRQLKESLEAVADIRECYRVLEKGGLNIVGEVLRDQGPFYEMDHYPKDDVYDKDSASQYYYHAHREDQDEHGHFHLFLRNGALPADEAPLLGPAGEDRVAHVVAISMDAWGFPTDLFSVNRWVTDESWLPAEAIIASLDRFCIDHAYPSWPVNRWMSAMVRCFRLQIEALLTHRYAVLARQDPSEQMSVLEDRGLEVVGSLPIHLDSWADLLIDETTRRAHQSCSSSRAMSA
ncbi:hypothetical protein [Marinobacter sp. CHS3-4]|uniref:DUF6969 family protein n=1 Tax=Marinobacter sp. CHS3-4 TaxID=3045174 RepID=UPI0024B4D55A|nr:hypothetical protein [Marinobacter sp. CHS3-4]MDI9243678.1 hypothetical protein [Marinobacter sp. CHS3-4]